MKYIARKFADIVPYSSKKAVPGLYLDANESSYNAPIELREYLSSKIKTLDLNRYPDIDSRDIREALAKKYNADADNFVVGVGSDELIDKLLAVTIDSDIVLDLNPSFSMYGFFIRINGGIEKRVELNSDFSFDVEKIISSIKEIKPKVVIICNPNNPTGSWIDNSSLEKIITSTDSLIVIDEAYGEFAHESAAFLGLKYPNVCVLKTFSKAKRLAGIRCGYMISSLENAQMLRVLVSPFNVSLVTGLAAIYALEHDELFLESTKATILERERVYKELKSLGYKVYPSQANFLWVILSKADKEKLTRNNIFIRHFLFEGQDYCRITIGLKQENNQLLNALKED